MPTNQNPFTVTGSAEDGTPLFMHGMAPDANALAQFVRSRCGDVGLCILQGHCESADGSVPDRVDVAHQSIEWAPRR